MAIAILILIVGAISIALEDRVDWWEAMGTRRIKQTTAANVFVAGQLQKRNNKISPQQGLKGEWPSKAPQVGFKMS